MSFCVDFSFKIRATNGHAPGGGCSMEGLLRVWDPLRASQASKKVCLFKQLIANCFF